MEVPWHISVSLYGAIKSERDSARPTKPAGEDDAGASVRDELMIVLFISQTCLLCVHSE